MSTTPLPKAVHFLTSLQAQTGPPSTRIFEDAVADMLSKPEDQWEEIARRAGLPFGPELCEKVKHLRREGYLEYLSSAAGDAPELQSIVDYSIMSQTKEAFDDLILRRFSQPERYPVSDKVFFGTIESASVNAMITAVPDSDEYLIVINRALWDIAKLLPFTLATTLFTEEFTFRSFDPGRSYPYLPLSAELLASIMNRTRPARSLPPLPPRDNPIAMVHLCLYRSIHDFILGHEYGHFLRGHFAEDGRTHVCKIGDLSFSQNTTAWRNEYEADRVGLDLAVIGAKDFMSHDANSSDPIAREAIGRAMSLGWLGCWASLQVLFHMDKTWRSVYTLDSSHPPSALRFAAMARTILRQHPSREMVEQAEDMLRSAGHCIAVMFEQSSFAYSQVSDYQQAVQSQSLSGKTARKNRSYHAAVR